MDKKRIPERIAHAAEAERRLLSPFAKKKPRTKEDQMPETKGPETSEPTLYLHCATCFRAGKVDHIAARAVPGALIVECEAHDTPMLVGRFEAKVDHVLTRGCAAKHS